MTSAQVRAGRVGPGAVVVYVGAARGRSGRVVACFGSGRVGPGAGVVYVGAARGSSGRVVACFGSGRSGCCSCIRRGRSEQVWQGLGVF